MEAGGRTYIAYCSKSDWIRLWASADWHYGNRACALSELKKDIKTIADDPHSFVFMLGDHAEFIGFKDPRFDALDISPDLKIKDLGSLGHFYMGRVRDIASPMKGKILGVLQGNHEKNYMKRQEQENLMHWLAKELETKYLGYSCLMDIIFMKTSKVDAPKIVTAEEMRKMRGINGSGNSTSFRCFLHHGAGNALTEGGKLNKLIQFMDRFDANLYFLGHVHDTAGKPVVKIGADAKCETITHVMRTGLITGSYLKTYEQGCTCYGEMKGYKPTVLGSRYIEVKPYTGEVRVVI